MLQLTSSLTTVTSLTIGHTSAFASSTQLHVNFGLFAPDLLKAMAAAGLGAIHPLSGLQQGRDPLQELQLKHLHVVGEHGAGVLQSQQPSMFKVPAALNDAALHVLAARWPELQQLHLSGGLPITAWSCPLVLPALTLLATDDGIDSFSVIVTCMPALEDLTYRAHTWHVGHSFAAATVRSRDITFRQVLHRLRRLCMVHPSRTGLSDADLLNAGALPTQLELQCGGAGCADLVRRVCCRVPRIINLTLRGVGGAVAAGSQGGVGLPNAGVPALEPFDDVLLCAFGGFLCLQSLHLDMARPQPGGAGGVVLTTPVLDWLVRELHGRGLRKLVLSGFAWAANTAYLYQREVHGRASQAWLWAELAPRYPLLEIVVEP
jgi:hypothetical protein